MRKSEKLAEIVNSESSMADFVLRKQKSGLVRNTRFPRMPKDAVSLFFAIIGIEDKVIAMKESMR